MQHEILFKSRHYQLLWTTVCVWSLGPSFEGGFYILIFNVKDSPPPHPLEGNSLYIFLTQFFSMHAHHMYRVTSYEVWIYMWWLEGHLSGQPVDTPGFSDVILNEKYILAWSKLLTDVLILLTKSLRWLNMIQVFELKWKQVLHNAKVESGSSANFQNTL